MNSKAKLSFHHPFNITTGNGLGISYSSLKQMEFDLWPYKPFGQSKTDCVVNCNNKNIYIKDRALRFEEGNGILELFYRYNNQAASQSNAWQLSIRKLTNISANSVTVIEEDGHETSYNVQSGSNIFQPSAFGNGTPNLVKNGIFWELYNPITEIIEFFDENGFLNKKMDRYGQTTFFEYKNGELSQIMSSSGDQYIIEKTKPSVSGYTTTISVQKAGEQVKTLLQTYNFDGIGRLVESVTPKGYKTTYTYWNTNRNDIYKIVQTDGSKFLFTYPNDDELVVTSGLEGTASFDKKYSITRKKNEKNVLDIRDNFNLHHYLTIDEKSRLIQYIAPHGFNETTDVLNLDYHQEGQIKQIKYPDGKADQFEYMPYLGLKIKEILSDSYLRQFFYRESKDNRPPLITTMTNGANQTNYVRQPDPKDSNKLKLRFEISPQGRVKEYCYQGSFVNEIREYGDTFYTDRHRPQDDYSTETLVAWAEKRDYKKIKLTSLNHNTRGQLHEKRTYIAVTKTDGKIQPDETNMSQEKFFPDFYGNVLIHENKQDINKIQTQTSEFNDDFKRQTSFKVSDQNTFWNYDDFKRIVSKQYPNNRIEILNYNVYGNPITVSISAKDAKGNDETRTLEYSLNKIVVTIVEKFSSSSETIESYQIYNYEGDLAFEISPTGSVTEYNYDHKKDYKTSVRYSNPISMEHFKNNPSKLMLDKLLLKDPVNDHYSYQLYDYKGRTQFTIDEDGYIVENLLDSEKRNAGKVSYLKKLDDNEIKQFISNRNELKIENNKDRFTQKFYDKDGHLIGEVDAAGYLTEYICDAANFITQKIIYFIPVTDRGRNSTFEEIKTKSGSKTANTYYFSNGKNEIEYEIDGEGYITKYEYYANSLLKSARRFSSKNFNFEDKSKRPDLPAPSTDDETIEYTYDILNRKTAIKYSNSKVEKFVYDVMDQIILSGMSEDDKEEQDPDKTRQTRTRFNGFGEAIAKANPFIAFKMLSASDPEIEKLWQSNSNREEYSMGLVVKSINSLNKTTIYYYDQEKRPIFSVSPTGFITEISYDTFWNKREIRRYKNTIPADKLKTFKGGLNLEEIKDYLVKTDNDLVDKFDYDKRGFKKNHTDAKNNVSKFETNAFKQLSKEIIPIADSFNEMQIDRQYDTRGNEISTTKQAGNITIKTSKEFNSPFNVITCEIDPYDKKMTYEQDLLGRRTAIINYLQNKTIIENNAFRAFKLIDEIFRVQETLYDQTTRTETTSLYQLPTRPKAEDKTESKLESKQEIEPIKTLFSIQQKNIFDEVISNKDALQNKTKTSHEPDGQVSSITNAIQSTVTSEHDSEGQLAYTTDAENLKTTLGRDDAGNILSQTEQKILPAAIATKESKTKDDFVLVKNPNDISNDWVTINKSQEVKKPVPNGPAYVTGFKNDSFGRVEEKTDPLQTVTTNQYDKCDNQLGSEVSIKQDKAVLATGNSFNAANQPLTLSVEQKDKNEAKLKDLKQTNKRTDRDSLGREIGQTIDPEGLQISNTQTLNKKGSVTSKTDEENNTTFYIRDVEDQIRFIVDPRRGVIEKIYDDNGQVIQTITYTNPLKSGFNINADSKPEEIKANIGASVSDTSSLYFYGLQKNQERFRLDLIKDEKGNPKAIVHETAYDDAFRPIENIDYSTTLDASDLAKFSTTYIENNIKKTDKDRTEYKILDALGRKRFVIDPKRYVTEFVYNNNNDVTINTVYANPLTQDKIKEIIQLNESEVQNRLPKDQDKDITEYNIYDDLKHLIYTVDGKGGVIGYDKNYYDDALSECQYDKKVSGFSSYDDLCNKLKSEYKPDPNLGRLSTMRYDEARRKRATTNPLGKQKQLTPDVLGNISDEKDEAEKLWVSVFDKASRLTETRTPLITKPELKQPIVTTKEYYKTGKTKTISEAKGLPEERTIAYEYDASGHLVLAKILDNGKEFKNPLKDVTGITVYQAAYNAKNNKISEQNKAGEWTYYVHDEQNKIIFSVNSVGAIIEHKRDTFGDEIETNQYNKPLTIKDNYRTNGIPLDDIISVITGANYNQSKQNYDTRGDLIRKEVLNGDKVITAEETQYNALRKTICNRKLIKDNDYSEKFTFYDKTSKTIAEIDEVKFVKGMERNIHGEITKERNFASALTVLPDANWSEAQLAQYLAQIKNEKDRVKEITYTLCGQVKDEIEKGLITQEPVPIKEQKINREVKESKALTFQNKSPQDATTSYQYNDVQDKTKTILPNKAELFHYHDERHALIGETGISRVVLDKEGKEIKVTPFSEYTVNGLNQVEEKREFKTGLLTPPTESYPDIQKSNDDYVVKTEWDKLDHVTKEIKDNNTLKLTSERKPNQKDLPLWEIDANNNKWRLYYDIQNRERFKIGPGGEIYEQVWDSFDNVGTTRIYDQKIDLSKITDKTSLDDIAKLVQISYTDTVTYQVYDQNKNLRYSINQIDQPITKDNKAEPTFKISIIGYQYDGQGKTTLMTEYSNFLSLAEIENKDANELDLIMKNKVDQKNDRTNYYVRNARGEPCILIGPEGAITEQEFDADGNMIKQTSYAKQVLDPKLIAALPLAKVKDFLKTIANSDHDRTIYYVYNYKLNKLEYEVDAMGGVTRYAYNISKQCLGKTLYAQPVVAKDYNDLLIKLQNLQPDPEHDQTFVNTLDEAGQIREEISPNPDYKDAYQYDIFGSQVTHTNKKGSKFVYGFDSAKRQTTTISPAILATQIKFDDRGKLAFTQQELQPIEEKKLDGIGNITKLTKAKETSDQREIESAYTASGQLKGTAISNVRIDDPSKFATQDFRQKPESAPVTIATNKFYNAKLQLVSEQATNNLWKFNVYDSSNHDPIYEINQVNFDQNPAKGFVVETEYNAFGNPSKRTTYSIEIIIPADYKENGIPRSYIESVLNKNDPEKREIVIQHNRLGKISSETSTEVYCADFSEEKETFKNTPNKLSAVQKIKPEVKHDYNTFGDEISCVTRVGAARSKTESSYYDKKGRKFAFVSPERYLKRSTFDRFDNEEQTVLPQLPLSERPAADATPQQIDSMIKPDPFDLTIVNTFDRQNNKKMYTLKNVRFYKPNYQVNPPTYQLVIEDVTLTYTYTPTGKIESIADEENDLQFFYYNACDHLVAQVDVPRALQLGTPDIGIPITKTGVNLHGQIVAVKRFKNNAKANMITKNEEIKKQLPNIEVDRDGNLSQGSDVKDQTSLTLLDNRGLTSVKQDREEYLTGTTVTPEGQVARTWCLKSSYSAVSADNNEQKCKDEKFIRTAYNYDIAHMSEDDEEKKKKPLKKNMIEYKCEADGLKYRVLGLDNQEKIGLIPWTVLPKDFPRKESDIFASKDKTLLPILEITSLAGHTLVSKVNLVRQTHVDEQITELDAHKRAIGTTVRRDRQIIETRIAQLNAYNEPIAEGPGNNEWPVQISRDSNGFVWKHNKNNGAYALQIPDLVGNVVLQGNSGSKDLKDIQYDNLPAITNDKEVSITVTKHNLEGYVANITSPDLYQPSNARNMPLQMCVGNQTFGNPSLSWTTPPAGNITGNIYFRRKGTQDPFLEFKNVKTTGIRTGIDLNELKTIIPDLSPDMYEYKIDYYLCNPVTKEKLDPKNIEYRSQGFFACEVGDAKNSRNVIVSAINDGKVLLSGNITNLKSVYIPQIKQTRNVTLEQGACYVDCSDLESGIYTFQPENQSSQLMETLPFTLYTANETPSKNPLSKEFSYSVKMESEEGSLNSLLKLTIVERYSKLPLLFICDYTTEGGTKESLGLTLNFDEKQDGYPVTFTKLPKSIDKLTLLVVPDEKHAISLYENAPPVIPTQAVKQHKMKMESHQLAKESKHELCLDGVEAISREEACELDDFECISKDSSNTIQSKPLSEAQLVTDFPKHNLVEIQPFDREFKDIPIVEFLDVSQDSDAQWKSILVRGTSANGFFIDTSGFELGNYPYRIQGDDTETNKDRVFFITDGKNIFSSQPYSGGNENLPVSHAFLNDREGNVVTEINSLQQRTDIVFSRGRPIQITQPAIRCKAPDDKITIQRPIIQPIYNKKGQYLGVVDGNGNFSGKILNQAGQPLAKIVGDGLMAKKSRLNNLDNEDFFYDSREKKWETIYNKNNLLMTTIRPDLVELDNERNEQGQRISYRVNNTTSYWGLDFFSNEVLFWKPNNDWIAKNVQPNGNLLKKSFSGGGELVISRDYFGVARYQVNIDGKSIQFEYDFNKHLKLQSSSGGPARKYYDYIFQKVPINVKIDGINYVINMDMCKGILKPCKDQKLEFRYSHGRLNQIIDHAHGRYMNYQLDTENRKISLEVRLLDGTLVHQSSTGYDAIGNHVRENDSILTLEVIPDLARNKRQITSILEKPQIALSSTNTLLNTFDRADRATTFGKIKEDARDIGLQRTYVGGLLDQEKRIEHGVLIETSVQYDNICLPEKTTVKQADGKTTTIDRKFTPVGVLLTKTTAETNQPTKIETRGYVYDGGPQISCLVKENDKFKSKEVVTEIKNGLPQKVVVSYNDENPSPNRDEITYTYRGNTDFILSVIEVLRRYVKNENEVIKQTGTTTIRQDANEVDNSVEGADDGAAIDEQPLLRIFDSCPNGQILKKYLFNRLFPSRGVKIEYMFQNPEGQALGRYGQSIVKDTASLFQDVKAYMSIAARGTIAKLVGAKISFEGIPGKIFINPQGGLEFNDTIKSIDADIPAVPDIYETQNDDETCAQVASAFADPNSTSATLVAAMNNLSENEKLRRSTPLTMPRLVPERSKMGEYGSYAAFKQKLIGNLSPKIVAEHLDDDDEDDFSSFIKQVAKIVVVGLAVFYAPYLAQFALGALGVGMGAVAAGTMTASELVLATNIATAVSASILDSVGQGALMGLGLQSKFSGTEALEVGLGQGLTSEATVLVGSRLVAAGIANATTQLAMMKINGTHKFDVRSVLVSMGAAVVGEHLGFALYKTPVQRVIAATAEAGATTLLTAAVYRRNPFVADLLSQAIGAAVVSSATEYATAQQKQAAELTRPQEKVKEAPVHREARLTQPRTQPAAKLSAQDQRFVDSIQVPDVPKVTKLQTVASGKTYNELQGEYNPRVQSTTLQSNQASMEVKHPENASSAARWSRASVESQGPSPKAMLTPKRNLNIGTRLMGLVEGIGGTAEATTGFIFGALTAETGVGIIAGGFMVAQGFDIGRTGFQTFLTGEDAQTSFEIVAENLGVSQNAAKNVETATALLSTNPAGLAKTATIVGKTILNESKKVAEALSKNGLFKPSSDGFKSIRGQIGSIGDDVNKTLKTIFEKYSKQAEQYNQLKNEQLEKAINSHEKQIVKHKEYIENPESHVPKWNELKKQHQDNLIYHWNQDIERHESYQSIAKQILKLRNKEEPKNGW